MTSTVFIMSDIHAFDGRDFKDPSAGAKPSYFDISASPGSSNANPIDDLKKLIKQDEIKSKYLFCLGDLGDRANPMAVAKVWQELNELKTLLGAERLISTIGNHDVDSRHQNGYDPRGVLLELAPQFPFASDEENNHFWTHHFQIVCDAELDARIVVVDTTAYHGMSSNEYKHGRVSERTLKRLLAKLKSQARPKFNVLICHHHPQKHKELDLGDYDDMDGGYELINALDPSVLGPWIVFHGHKHHPKISYAQGDSTTPVIFSAGSCAATLQPHLAGIRNQVYTVTFDDHNTPSGACLGQFQAWDWAPGLAWKPAQIGSGLPRSGGFGLRVNVGEVAKEIADTFPTGGQWSDVLNFKASLSHLIPSDISKLCGFLKNVYNYRIEESADGNPFLIQR